MLQSIRERLSGWVALAFIAIIGIPLVLTFGAVDSPISFNRAAEVNGLDISQAEYNQALQSRILQWEQSYQSELPPELRTELGRAVLDGLVNSRLVESYVTDAGYRVSDQQVADYIRSIEAFQIDGEFSQSSYEGLLASNGLTPGRFENDQRRALVATQLQESLVNSAFFTPTDFRRFIRLDAEQRDIDYALFAPADFAEGIVIDAADIEAYYEANVTRFQTAEAANIEYLEVILDDVASTVEVDEADIRDYYDANVDNYQTAEERLSRHILIGIDDDTDDEAALATATDLAARITAGEDFAELATEFSDDPGSAADGGNLGWNPQGVFVPEFDEALFSMNVGAVSEPVKTEFGYHLIRLDEVKSGDRKSYEEVRDDLRAEMQLIEAEEAFYDLAAELDDQSLNSVGGLSGVAEEMGLELKRVDGFTRAGGVPLGNSPELISAVFNPLVLEDGENTPVIELDDGRRAVVVHVAEYLPPAAQPLAEVSERIEGLLTGERAAGLAREAGAEAVAAVAAGAELADALPEGSELVNSGLVGRQSADIPQELLNEVFRLPASQAGSGTVQSLNLLDGRFAVYRLLTVEPGRPGDLDRNIRDARKDVLARQQGAADAAMVLAEIRSEASVTVNETIFEDDPAVLP